MLRTVFKMEANYLANADAPHIPALVGKRSLRCPQKSAKISLFQAHRLIFMTSHYCCEKDMSGFSRMPSSGGFCFVSTWKTATLGTGGAWAISHLTA